MADAPSAWPETQALSLVERIHDTPHRTVYAFAGAGSQALAWLHAVGGSSRTVLEANDHYHPASLTQALGAAPVRAAAPEVAAGLARAAWARAARLTAGEARPGPLFGLGLAATIATNRAKRGSHRVHVASADPLGTAWTDVVLAKGRRDRTGEEGLASLLALHAAAAACGVLGLPEPAFVAGDRQRTGFEPGPELAAFLADPEAVLALDRDGRPYGVAGGRGDSSTAAWRGGPSGTPGAGGGEGPAAGSESRPKAIVSGSFHPLHEGHLRLAEAAEAYLGTPVGLELPLVNADKAPVDVADARRRAAQAYGRRPLLLTHAALFAQKARRLPGTVFVVGVDTARRVLEPRFYGGSDAMRAALATVRDLGCRFLVAGREADGSFRTGDELDVPAGFEALFEPLPSFRVDLSSTELRAAWP